MVDSKLKVSTTVFWIDSNFEIQRGTVIELVDKSVISIKQDVSDKVLNLPVNLAYLTYKEAVEDILLALKEYIADLKQKQKYYKQAFNKLN